MYIGTQPIRLFVRQVGRPVPKPCELHLNCIDTASPAHVITGNRATLEIQWDEAVTGTIERAQQRDKQLLFGLLLPDGRRYLLRGKVSLIEVSWPACMARVELNYVEGPVLLARRP